MPGMLFPFPLFTGERREEKARATDEEPPKKVEEILKGERILISSFLNVIIWLFRRVE